MSTQYSTTQTQKGSCERCPTDMPRCEEPTAGSRSHHSPPASAARSVAFFARHLGLFEANRALALYRSFGSESPHRTELVRCAVLFQFGGVWLDIDAVLVQPLHDVFPHRHVSYTTVSSEKGHVMQGGVADAAPAGLHHFKRSIEALLQISPRMVARDKYAWPRQVSAMLKEELNVAHTLRPGAFHGYSHAWELLAEGCHPSNASGPKPGCDGDPLRRASDAECCYVRGRDSTRPLLTVQNAQPARGQLQSAPQVGMGDAGRRASSRQGRAARVRVSL